MGIFRDIGAPGVIILILGALLIFGPKRLPEFKKSVSDIENKIDKKDEKNENDKEKKNN